MRPGFFFRDVSGGDTPAAQVDVTGIVPSRNTLRGIFLVIAVRNQNAIGILGAQLANGLRQFIWREIRSTRAQRGKHLPMATLVNPIERPQKVVTIRNPPPILQRKLCAECAATGRETVERLPIEGGQYGSSRECPMFLVARSRLIGNDPVNVGRRKIPTTRCCCTRKVLAIKFVTANIAELRRAAYIGDTAPATIAAGHRYRDPYHAAMRQRVNDVAIRRHRRVYRERIGPHHAACVLSLR